MARDIDDKKKRKALAKLRRAKRLMEQSQTPDQTFSAWEEDFLESVEDRLETFGSAFNDPEKGALDEPLSALQALKLKEIEKKAKGKDKPRYSSFKSKQSSFKSKAPARRYGRDIHEDIIDDTPLETPEPALPPTVEKGFKPRLVVAEPDAQTPAPLAAPQPEPETEAAKPRFQVIAGGLEAKAS